MDVSSFEFRRSDASSDALWKTYIQANLGRQVKADPTHRGASATGQMLGCSDDNMLLIAADRYAKPI